MRILVIADIHNDVESLPQFLDKAEGLKFDVIVCPGDFLDAPPTGVTREEIGFIILEELKALGKPVLAVPGNQDDIMISVFEDEGMSVHGVGKTIGGVGFYGFGGSKTPFGTAYEPSDSEIGAGLERAHKDVEGSGLKVQVTHNPPVNTKLDIIPSGAHVGSEAVRKFIEDKKPQLAICAHIHEARGVDVIGDTKVINPGRFPEGYCGIVEISEGGVDAKVVNLI